MKQRERKHASMVESKYSPTRTTHMIEKKKKKNKKAKGRNTLCDA